MKVNPALLYNHVMILVLYLTGFFLERKPCTICSLVCRSTYGTVPVELCLYLSRKIIDISLPPKNGPNICDGSIDLHVDRSTKLLLVSHWIY
jgi:hypothetical protein